MADEAAHPPIYLVLVIKRVFLSGGVRAEHLKPYSKMNTLLYCVGLPVLKPFVREGTDSTRSVNTRPKSLFIGARYLLVLTICPVS